MADFFKRLFRRGRPPKEDKTAQDWLREIKRAQKVKDKWWEEQRIGTALQYWQGRQRPQNWSADEWITINLFYSTIMAELPALYSGEPEFLVRIARSFSPDPKMIPQMELKGKARAAMLNYIYRTEGGRDKTRQAIFDALFAFGVLKFRADVEMEENPLKGQPMLDEDGVPLLDEESNPIMEPDEIQKGEAEWEIERVHPLDFLVDEDAGPLGDSIRWKAQRIKMSLEKVRADSRYDAKVRKAIRATEVSNEEKAREEMKKGTFDRDQDSLTPDVCTLWEVYDLENGKWLTVAEGCDQFLAPPQDLPTGIEDDPFATLRFTRQDDLWYPVSPAGQWIDSQHEYNEVRSCQMRHRKNVSKRKYILYGSAFEDPENEARKLADGDDGTIIVAQNPIGFEAVSPIKDAPLDQSIHAEQAYYRQDFQELAIGANQRGSFSGIDSATEAGILEQRARVRENDKRDMVADFLAEFSRKLDKQVQQLFDREQAVEVIGADGEAAWVLIKSEDYSEINGEYQYEVSLSQALPNMPEVERAQLIQFYSLLAQFPLLMTSPALMKHNADLFGIRNANVVNEMVMIGKAMMAGAPQPGGGSIPGTPDARTAAPSTTGGMAMGGMNQEGV